MTTFPTKGAGIESGLEPGKSTGRKQKENKMKKYTSSVAAQLNPISDEERHAYKDVAQLERMIYFLEELRKQVTYTREELEYDGHQGDGLEAKYEYYQQEHQKYSEIIDFLQSTMETKLYEHRMGMITLRVKKTSEWGDLVFPFADDIDNLLCMLDADGNTELREKLYTGKLQIDEWLTLQFNDHGDSADTGWVVVRTSCGCPCYCP